MKGNQEGCEALTAAPRGHGRRGDMTRMHRRPGALAVLVAVISRAMSDHLLERLHRRPG